MPTAVSPSIMAAMVPADVTSQAYFVSATGTSAAAAAVAALAVSWFFRTAMTMSTRRKPMITKKPKGGPLLESASARRIRTAAIPSGRGSSGDDKRRQNTGRPREITDSLLPSGVTPAASSSTSAVGRNNGCASSFGRGRSARLEEAGKEFLDLLPQGIGCGGRRYLAGMAGAAICFPAILVTFSGGLWSHIS